MKFNLKSVQEKLGKKYVLVLLFVFSLCLFLMMFTNVRQKEMNIKEGQLAEETIRANKQIENKYETEEKRRLVAETINPEYSYDKDQGKKQVDLIKSLFTMITKVSNDSEADYQQRKEKAKNKEAVQKETSEEKIASLKKKFEDVNQDDIPFYQGFPNIFYENMFELSEDEVRIVQTESIKIVEKVMSDRIRSSNLGEARQVANNDIQYLDVEANLQQLIKYIVDRGIVVNEVANEKKTEELKEIARNSVSPVMIYAGEIIVREGVQIDSKAIQKLELLGMTSTNTSVFPIVALVMLIILQLIMLIRLVLQTVGEQQKLRFLTFYCLMMFISIAGMKFLQLFQTEAMSYVPLIFPAAFTPLVLNLFINRRAGIIGALFQAAFSLFVFYDLMGTNTLLITCVSYMFTGFMAVLIKRERIGAQLKSASLWLIIYPVTFMIILTVYQGMEISDSKTWYYVLCAIAGCLFSFLMSVGLHPYIELMLNDDSMIVLNELSNPNHPLLKRLLEEAPGTYHHSMMVASLSANAVAEIGGKSLLTRVGCYYHDIGKIKHANFFVENLPAGVENPHNFLLPEDSREVIFSHVTEGSKMLKAEKMPKIVIDICEQHHGTTLMKFFYVKAKERNPEVTEAEFRYPGPKPQTREAGVVSIADTCEAAVRAMDHPTNEKIQEFVHNLIESRIKEGELDESGLTLKEIRVIEKSIVSGLCSTFHSRIKYPKMKSEAEEMKKEQEERIP